MFKHLLKVFKHVSRKKPKPAGQMPNSSSLEKKDHFTIRGIFAEVT